MIQNNTLQMLKKKYFLHFDTWALMNTAAPVLFGLSQCFTGDEVNIERLVRGWYTGNARSDPCLLRLMFSLVVARSCAR